MKQIAVSTIHEDSQLSTHFAFPLLISEHKMNPRARKQWSLTKQRLITSFEAWRQNLQYILSLDRNFAGFLADGVTWLKKCPGNPRRGLQDDPESVPQASHRTAQQKCSRLELRLGQIANYCLLIYRNTIVKSSTQPP